MEKREKSRRKKIKIGEPGYLNENCWLVKGLNYPPYKRCQYCELKFRNCLFLHYQIVSLILIIFILILSFLIEGSNSELLIISVFTLIIIYGYFFNKSTDKIIKANFAQRKANEALEELSQNLQKKVDEQTKEIRKAYEVEKKAHEELKKLDKAKSQFILATQHHLRTPLTSMQGYLDLILKGTFGKIINKKIKEKLARFQTSTKNLINIVEEILNISQFQLGRKVVSLEPNTPIEPILEEIISELLPEAEKKGIYLKLEKPEKLPKIKADAPKLKMAIFNIIDNAVKYTEKGGVTVKLEVADSNLRIITKDTGIGIAKEETKNLFNKVFERGEKAEKLFTTGRGIGLFIASKMVQAHHGKVWAESEGPGKGSTFYIELPIK